MSQEVDLATVLGAVIEHLVERDGTLEVPFEVFQRVANNPVERAISVDVDPERQVLILGVANVDDIVLEDENE